MTVVARPFLKWVGSKRALVPELLKWIPPKYKNYHEPFLGGGALFFALQPKKAVLSDLNERLIRTYRGVRDHVENVIGYLNDHYAPLHTKHGKDFYLHVRAENVSHLSDVGVAAWFIFLNKTSFNGLWRVNQSGGYNVPYGRNKNPTICDAENLRACSKALQGVEILHQDFRKLPARKHRGEFFYYDSPFVPVSDTANFTSYTAEGFGPNDQLALRDLALWLKDQGAFVLLSNAGTDAVKKLYADPRFETRTVAARRAVNSDASKRGAVKEFIIR